MLENFILGYFVWSTKYLEENREPKRSRVSKSSSFSLEHVLPLLTDRRNFFSKTN
jgi:hypothetical protein